MIRYRIAALAPLLAFSLSAGAAHAQITNPLSVHPIEADGAYTGSNPSDNTQWQGEWSDIAPAWFISNSASGATPVAPGAPGANSLLFAGLSKDASTTLNPNPLPELYLMYDYLGRTNPPTQPNEFLGSVSFPLNIGGTPHNSTVTFQTVSNFTPALLGGQGFFDVFVTLDGGTQQIPASSIGLEAGLFVGQTPVDSLWGVTAASPFHTTPHELIELGVPLLIDPNFGTSAGTANAFPGGVPGDGKGDGYSPDPAFWSSNICTNAGDPPASGGIFTIHPDGSTGILPQSVPVPEPATCVLLALTTIGLWGIGRKRLGERRKT